MTIKSICNAYSYLSALSFVSYSTVSIGYSKEKYCMVFAIVMVSHHTRKFNVMVFHHTVRWCHLAENI